jgi:hypothetical protein
LNTQINASMGSKHTNVEETAGNSVFLRKVAIKWKNLEQEAKERYKLLARNERERYKVELAMWEREQAATAQGNPATKRPPTIRSMEHQAMDPYGCSSGLMSIVKPSGSQAQGVSGWIVTADLGICVSSTYDANDVELDFPSRKLDWPRHRSASSECEGCCQATTGVCMPPYDPLELEHTIHTCADGTISSRHVPSAYPYTQQMLHQSSYEWEHEALFLEPLPLDDAWPTFCMNEKRLDASVPGNRNEHTCSPDTVDRLISILDKEERDLLLLHCSSLA